MIPFGSAISRSTCRPATERAIVPPLVGERRSRRAAVRLVPESDATYADLADALSPFTRQAGPAVIEGHGRIASLAPADLPVTPANPFKPITEVQPLPGNVAGPGRQVFDLLRVGPPLGDPVWMRTKDGGLLLVQPFTFRVLVWNPRTGALRTTDSATPRRAMV